MKKEKKEEREETKVGQRKEEKEERKRPKENDRKSECFTSLRIHKHLKKTQSVY